MGAVNPNKRTMLVCLTDSFEFMITFPSGVIRFMGFWKGIGFICDSMRDGYDVRMDQ